MSRQEESTLFFLAGQAVACAGNLVTEPRSYGPYRLLQMARRVCDSSAVLSAASPRLEALGHRIDEVLSLWSLGEEEFFKAAQGLVSDVVTLAQRGREGPGTASPA